MDIATLGLTVNSRQVVTAKHALDRLTPAARRAETATRGLGTASAITAAAMRAFVPIIAGGALIHGTRQLFDATTRIENALKVAGLSGATLSHVYDRLFESAHRNVAPIEALVQLYSRASLVQKELGVSTGEVLNFTDKIAVALRVSGKSASEASGALLQLSQALGSGIVRAEEFNSILEGALPIAQAAAFGLEEAGGSVAKLRSLVIDGKISSEAFFRAFEAGASILDDKVAGAELTVSQGFIRLQNVLIDTAGKFDDTTGASAGLAYVIGFVADVIGQLGDDMEKLQAPFARVGGWIDTVRDKFAEWREVLGLRAPFLDTVRDKFFEGTSAKMIEARAAAVDSLRESLSRLPADAGKSSGDMMDDRFAAAFGTGNTVSLGDYEIPGTSDAASNAEEMAKAAIDKLIESLAFEEAQLGRTAREQAIFNALNQAGVDVTSKYGQEIAGAAGRVYDLATALDKAAERQQMVADAAKDFLGGFVSDILDGKSAVDALSGAVGRLADKLISMALDQAIDGLFKNLAGAVGGAVGGGVVGANVGLFHSGHGPGDPITATRYVHPAYFDNAPRHHSGIGPGEHAAVIRNDESVLTPGQMRQLAPSGGSGGPVTVNIMNAPPGTTATTKQSREPGGGMRLDVMLKRSVDDTGATLIDSGESAMNASIERRYGLRPQL